MPSDNTCEIYCSRLVLTEALLILDLHRVARCNPIFALRMKGVLFSGFVFPLPWHRRKALSKYYCKAWVVQPNPSIICYNFSAGSTSSSLWGMLTHPGQFITRQGLEQVGDATWMACPGTPRRPVSLQPERTARQAASRVLQAGGGKDGGLKPDSKQSAPLPLLQGS